MDKVTNFGSGWRTYAMGAIMVILSGLKSQGYIDDHSYQTVMGLVAGAGLIFLRKAVA